MTETDKRRIRGLVRNEFALLKGYRIKVIKRMAYSYRDNDYFFLKIKATFPGKAR